MKENSRGLIHLFRSTANSLRGLKVAVTQEAAFRQEVLLVALLFSYSIYLNTNFVEWVILILPLFTLLIVELLNSSIETVVDRIGEDYHKLSGAAKDMASAAVFVNLLLIVLIWVTFLLNYYSVVDLF